MELRQLKTGDVFKIEGLEGYEWIALEQDSERERTLVISSECVDRMPFDEDNYNDFRESTVREYLNYGFMKKLEEAGLDIRNIEYTNFDLRGHKGDKVYSDCTDRIGLLSEEQYEKYSDVLKLDDYWWLITPNSANSHVVRSVHTSGALHNNIAYFGNPGLRPLCNLKSDIEVSLINQKVDNEDGEDMGLSSYSTKELLEELLKREEA